MGAQIKTSGSGNSDIFSGVSSVTSNNRVKVSYKIKDFFHKKSLQEMYYPCSKQSDYNFIRKAKVS
jgi:hypothetical protein